MANSVKDRLISFIEYKGLSKNKFEQICGFSKRYVSNISVSLQPDKIEKISLNFPELNIEWLLTGEGRMIKGPYERINQILEREGITQKEFAKGAGGMAFLAPSIYSNAQKNPGDPHVLGQWVDLALKRFPNYSREWILTGEGEMLKESRPVTPAQTFSPRTDRNLTVQNIPLYDFNAAAGLVAIFNDLNVEPMDYLRIPNLPAVDGALFVRGESMSPLLKSGDIVMYKRKELTMDSILWGEIYLLSFQSDGDSYTAVKYIQKSDTPGMLRLASFNPSFAPKDIPMESITALALVKASLTFHTME